MRTQAIVKKLFKIVRVIGEIILLLWVSHDIWSEVQYKHHADDASAIDQLYITFEGYLREGDFARAYELTSPEYRRQYSLDLFTLSVSFVQKDEKYRLHPKRNLMFYDNKAIIVPHDTTQPPAYWRGIGFECEKIDGKWYLTGETQSFVD